MDDWRGAMQEMIIDVIKYEHEGPDPEGKNIVEMSGIVRNFIASVVHKIQGTTLETAEIDVGNQIFEYGQTYVALIFSN